MNPFTIWDISWSRAPFWNPMTIKQVLISFLFQHTLSRSVVRNFSFVLTNIPVSPWSVGKRLQGSITLPIRLGCKLLSCHSNCTPVHVIHLLAPWIPLTVAIKYVIEPQNNRTIKSFRLENIFKVIEPSDKPILPSKHHTWAYSSFKYLQGWWLSHFPGKTLVSWQPFPWMFPSIQSKWPLAQLEVILSCPKLTQLCVSLAPFSCCCYHSLSFLMFWALFPHDPYSLPHLFDCL